MATSGKDIGNMLARRRAEQREVYIFQKWNRACERMKSPSLIFNIFYWKMFCKNSRVGGGREVRIENSI